MGTNGSERGRAPLRIVVDDRERAAGLPEAVATLWPETYVGRLPAGDVEIGPRILVERKTMTDFAASLADGRLFRQAHGLSRAASHPLLILEGEDSLDAAGIPPRALRGVLLTLLVGYRLPLLRTGSLSETAVWLARIAKQESRRLARRDRPAPRTPVREALDILGAVPGVGDARARRLVRAFGSIRAVLAASEEELAATPGIGPAIARSVARAGGSPFLSPPED